MFPTGLRAVRSWGPGRGTHNFPLPCLGTSWELGIYSGGGAKEEYVLFSRGWLPLSLGWALRSLCTSQNFCTYENTLSLFGASVCPSVQWVSSPLSQVCSLKAF